MLQQPDPDKPELNRSVDKKDHVLIGEIVGVHGIKGTNKIRSYADSLSLFKPGCSILVRESGGQEKSREIKWVKPHTGTALISFKGIIEHDQAQALIGAELFVPKDELPELGCCSIETFFFQKAAHCVGRLGTLIDPVLDSF